jgi:hypothetical protein
MKHLFYSCCSLDHLLSSVQINEAIKAASIGDEILFSYCDGVLSKCQVNTSGNPLICKLCRSNSKTILKNLPKSAKILPLKKRNRRIEGEIIKSFYFNTIEELKSLNYKGVAIGYGALSYYISCTRNHNPELSINFRHFIYEIFAMSIDMIDQIQNIIENLEPSKIQLFNGRQFQTRPFMDLAVANQIPFICNEVKWDFIKNSGWKIVHFENTLPHDIENAYKRSLYAWENSKLSIEERQILGQSFFEKRREGIPAGDKVFISEQQKNLLPDGFDPSKRNITIFNSSEDEFAALGAEFDTNKLFDSQLAGIEYILKEFKNNNDFVFYLRIHPNLAKIIYSYHTDIYDLQNKYSNLKIIPPESKVSTYSLIDYSEKIVVFGSTTGVEAVYWGKPVILLGTSFYKFHNICYQPNAKEEIKSLVLTKLEPKEKLGAIIYGHYIIDNNILCEQPEYLDINPPVIKILNHSFTTNRVIRLSKFELLNKLLTKLMDTNQFDKLYFHKNK